VSNFQQPSHIPAIPKIVNFSEGICDRLQRVYIYSDIRVPLVCFVIQIFHACSHVSNKTLVWYTRV